MLSETLSATILGNALAGKGVIRTDELFNSTSSFYKF